MQRRIYFPKKITLKCPKFLKMVIYYMAWLHAHVYRSHSKFTHFPKRSRTSPHGASVTARNFSFGLLQATAFIRQFCALSLQASYWEISSKISLGYTRVKAEENQFLRPQCKQNYTRCSRKNNHYLVSKYLQWRRFLKYERNFNIASDSW